MSPEGDAGDCPLDGFLEGSQGPMPFDLVGLSRFARNTFDSPLSAGSRSNLTTSKQR